jgi:hypothetical protein
MCHPRTQECCLVLLEQICTMAHNIYLLILNVNEFYTRQYDEIKRTKQKEFLIFTHAFMWCMHACDTHELIQF